jgi:hypothetical protein
VDAKEAEAERKDEEPREDMIVGAEGRGVNVKSMMRKKKQKNSALRGRTGALPIYFLASAGTTRT